MIANSANTQDRVTLISEVFTGSEEYALACELAAEGNGTLDTDSLQRAAQRLPEEREMLLRMAERVRGECTGVIGLKEVELRQRMTMPDRRQAPPEVQQVREQLDEYIIEQDVAKDRIAEFDRTIRAGSTMPQAMLMVGPPGVGKTEMSKALGKTYHSNPDAVVFLDCAAYKDITLLGREVGIGPGYTGYGDKPKFHPDRIREKFGSKGPVIFHIDEPDKMPPKVATAFWGMVNNLLNDGTIELGDGTKFDFIKEYGGLIVSIASNAGMHTAPEDVAPETLDRHYEEEGRASLPQHIDSRITAVVPFRPLTRDGLTALAKMSVDKAIDAAQRNAAAEGRRIELSVETSVSTLLADLAFSPKLGGRPIKQIAEQILRPILMEAAKRVPDGAEVAVRLDESAITDEWLQFTRAEFERNDGKRPAHITQNNFPADVVRIDTPDAFHAYEGAIPGDGEETLLAAAVVRPSRSLVATKTQAGRVRLYVHASGDSPSADAVHEVEDIPPDLANADEIHLAAISHNQVIAVGMTLPSADAPAQSVAYIVNTRSKEVIATQSPTPAFGATLGAVDGRAVLFGGRDVVRHEAGLTRSAPLDLAQQFELGNSSAGPMAVEWKSVTLDPGLGAFDATAVNTSDGLCFAGGRRGDDGTSSARAVLFARDGFFEYGALACPVAKAGVIVTDDGPLLVGGEEDVTLPSGERVVLPHASVQGLRAESWSIAGMLPTPAVGLLSFSRGSGAGSVVGPFPGGEIAYFGPGESNEGAATWGPAGGLEFPLLSADSWGLDVETVDALTAALGAQFTIDDVQQFVADGSRSDQEREFAAVLLGAMRTPPGPDDARIVHRVEGERPVAAALREALESAFLGNEDQIGAAIDFADVYLQQSRVGSAVMASVGNANHGKGMAITAFANAFGMNPLHVDLNRYDDETMSELLGPEGPLSPDLLQQLPDGAVVHLTGLSGLKRAPALADALATALGVGQANPRLMIWLDYDVSPNVDPMDAVGGSFGVRMQRELAATTRFANMTAESIWPFAEEILAKLQGASRALAQIEFELTPRAQQLLAAALATPYEPMAVLARRLSTWLLAPVERWVASGNPGELAGSVVTLDVAPKLRGAEAVRRAAVRPFHHAVVQPTVLRQGEELFYLASYSKHPEVHSGSDMPESEHSLGSEEPVVQGRGIDLAQGVPGALDPQLQEVNATLDEGNKLAEALIEMRARRVETAQGDVDLNRPDVLERIALAKKRNPTPRKLKLDIQRPSRDKLHHLHELLEGDESADG